LKLLASILAFVFIVTGVVLTPFSEAQAATQSQITRSQAETRALSMINLKWTYSSGTNSTIATQYATYVTKPKQLINIGG